MFPASVIAQDMKPSQAATAISAPPRAAPIRLVLVILTSRQVPVNDDQTWVGRLVADGLADRARPRRLLRPFRLPAAGSGPAPATFAATAKARRSTASAPGRSQRGPARMIAARSCSQRAAMPAPNGVSLSW